MQDKNVSHREVANREVARLIGKEDEKMTRKTFTRAELRRGLGDYTFVQKADALKVQKASKARGHKATLHRVLDYWQVRVRD